MFLAIWIYAFFTEQTFALENVNLALNMPSSQSTSAFGTKATMANDGNREMQFSSGTCSHTDLELAPWWTVDLMGVHSIHSLRIYNRDEQGCASELDLRCQDRLAGFKVHVSDEINDTVPVTRFKHLCHVDADTPQVPAIVDINCTSSVIGRYVTVSLNLTSAGYLTLCEVEVYGTEVKYVEQSATTSSTEKTQLSRFAISSATTSVISSFTSLAAEKKKCCCSFKSQTSRISQSSDIFMSFVLNDLDIDKKSVKKERRKYISMSDDRMSSAAISMSFIGVTLTFCGIILCDVKKMLQNVTEYRSLYM